MPARPIVIAHRGASGYLPEHTLVAKALAVGLGADYLEQDVVATRDGALIVFHDLILDDTTDVRAKFPGRARTDGHYYCIDFTLAEIAELTVGERRIPGGNEPRFPQRFPDGAGRFPIVTLREELDFIRGLRCSMGRPIGIYPEVKEPDWHRRHGVELGAKLLGELDASGFGAHVDGVFIQCFDASELQRLRQSTTHQLVQLLDSAGGQPTLNVLQDIRHYADAIGPSLKLVCRGGNGAGATRTTLVKDAHRAGLAVHAYTARQDELPPGVGSFSELMGLLFADESVDGVFTDFPDLVCGYLGRQG